LPAEWIDACGVEDVDPEDVIEFTYEGKVLAIYRDPDGRFYATDGICTHEQAHLADGLVMGSLIECPKHNGRFDYRTGQAKRTPVCIDLHTYEVKVEDTRVLVRIG
jgi:3-phenylpropionate/trans-cinnamate dioxygenase ferredoxin subunit